VLQRDPPAADNAGMDSPLLRRFATLLWTDEPRTRIRLQQWSLTVAIYVLGAGAMTLFARMGVTSGAAIVAWLACVLPGLAVFHALIRTQWSRKLADPSMSQSQIVFGIFAVCGGYPQCGEARSAVMFPLMLILTFGAFSVPWQRMVALTLFALAATGATMLAMHALRPGAYAPVIDLSNFLVGAIVLPAVTAVAVLLGRLRERLHRQRSELKAALARIQDLAIRDELTGLANRRHAQQLLAYEANRNEHAAQPFAVALIDLDHFKRLNDCHGHAGGDEVLRRFADEARASVCGFELVARWGGEEFLLLMPGATAAVALATTDRLRARIEDVHMPRDGGVLRFTCSAGVAEHVPGQTVAQTLSRADEALYRAKAAGRNRVELAPAERADGAANDAFAAAASWNP
jgi:diguanylate cyclase (GGDEF)-like protein